MELYESYFLNHKNIVQFMGSKNKEPTVIVKEFPGDKLFWCFFIAWKGEVEYEHLKLFNKLELMQRRLKIEFMEKINVVRKQLKIKSTVDDNLMEETVNMKTVVALALLEKINILFSNEKSFFLTVNDPNKKYYHIFNNTIQEISLEEIEKIKESRIQRRDIDKVLGSISSYKVAELREMYHKIGGTESMIKQKLYDEIIKYCKNF